MVINPYSNALLLYPVLVLQVSGKLLETPNKKSIMELHLYQDKSLSPLPKSAKRSLTRF